MFLLHWVKLILQPILENAIAYGVSGMDDCGEIRVTGRIQEGSVILSVTDNGIRDVGGGGALPSYGQRQGP